MPTVGILGGGQLGRMLALAAHNINVKTVVLDPTPNCAASQVTEHILGAFTDPAKIAELAKRCDVLTVEIEHVNAAALASAAAAAGVPVHPSPETIELIQDKYKQKVAMKAAGVPLGDFMSVDTQEDVAAAAKVFGYPLMLKSRCLAYDGRGNAVVKDESGIAAAWSTLASKGSLYVEKWVPFAKELAVVVARDKDGNCKPYQTVHTIQQDNICHVVIVPAQVSGAVQERAGEVARQAISALGGAGVYGVELFLLEDGSVMLNEIAPRVHNSGHYTTDACVCSQFEQHLRCVLGMPLGDPSLKCGAAAMVNVLGTGDAPEDEDKTWAICSRAFSVPGAAVHWYGKHGVKRGRKVGHINVVGESPAQVLDRVAAILNGTSTSTAAALSAESPMVGVIMGSDSDLSVMQAAASTLQDFKVPFELTIVSAHRTPKRLFEYATSARARGLKVIIAAAGGAAHLPGMVASLTPLPVIGVPVPLKHLDGMDSLYSILQMPRGIPVATVAIGNATNAALLAVRMLGSFLTDMGDKMAAYQAKLETEVLHKASALEACGWESAIKHGLTAPAASGGAGGK